MPIFLSIQTRVRAWRYREDLPVLLKLLDPRREDVILDIGAGTGYISSIVSEYCDDLYALVPNSDRVEFIKRKYPEVKVFEGKSEHVPFPDSYFDKVYAVSSFHHFEDQEDALEEMARITKHKGIIVVHETDPKNAKGSQSLAKERVRFLGPRELQEMAELHGCAMQSISKGKNGYFFLGTIEKAEGNGHQMP
ncbi:MAG: class I SAM-dependent methyltransferase [Nitrososphaerales archaeon]